MGTSMIRHGIKAALLAALLFASGAQAQLYTKFGPVTGVLKGNVSTPQTSAAAAADITGLFSCITDTSHYLNGAGTCTVPAGTGVTSVGLTAPSWYTVTGSPVTSSGTIAITAATGQPANRVIATPDGTTGAVSLRALVAGDIPPINLGSTANGGVSSATILLGTNGGTSNAFFSVTGPTTALRTFTFPNASATVLTTNAAVTVAQGGTGLATLTANGVLLGEGTSNVSPLVMGADTVLRGTASADPVAAAVPNCGSGTTALNYSTSTHAFGCQTLTGGSAGVTSVTAGTGLTASPNPIIATGTVSVDQTASLTWTGTEIFRGGLSRGGTTSQIAPGIVSNNILIDLTTSAAGTDKKTTELLQSAAGDFVIQTLNEAASSTSDILRVVRGTGVAVSTITLGNATDNPVTSIAGTGGLSVVGPAGIGGATRTGSGAASIGSASATTVATLPNTGTGTYFVSCAVSGGSGTSQSVAGFVFTNGTNATLTALGSTSGSIAVTMSGLNLQCTQNIGGTQSVSWSYFRWGS